jgi:EAL domain-containing protein (putative c-di-GMP-specific phosphodiesterase class I)
VTVVGDISIARFTGWRVLVVEDHGFQRWAVEQMLLTLGVSYVCAVGDGNEALERLRDAEPQFDLVLTDLNMPGIDGIEFIRRVGEAGVRAPLMVVSEQDPVLLESVAAMARAYGIGLVAALRKPLTTEKLARAMSGYEHCAPSPTLEMTAPSSEDIHLGLQYGQFEPHFQAKVDLATGKISGAEALARWRHPRRGLLAAGAFIPSMEGKPVLRTLTDVMLRRSLACCERWRAAGSPATVSLNLSLTLLADVSLADRLEDTVARLGMKPSDVVLEVTETAAAAPLGHVLGNLSRMRLKGFGLSMDDYGTGYSTLEQLARIPFTELKIDRSFVCEAESSAAARAVLESCLEIAEKLRIPAVAEGVESEQQHRQLRSLGCALGQGHYYAAPLPSAEFARILASRL